MRKNKKNLAIKLEKHKFSNEIKDKKNRIAIGKISFPVGIYCELRYASGTRVIKFSNTLLFRNQLIEKRRVNRICLSEKKNLQRFKDP